jgi:hypothetical protein
LFSIDLILQSSAVSFAISRYFDFHTNCRTSQNGSDLLQLETMSLSTTFSAVFFKSIFRRDLQPIRYSFTSIYSRHLTKRPVQSVLGAWMHSLADHSLRHPVDRPPSTHTSAKVNLELLKCKSAARDSAVD